MDYDIIIGLEIHAEIKSNSKMFCSCRNETLNQNPNTTVCPICLGHPGTLPLVNQEAINKVILLGLALNCQINRLSKFDRKNYFYPDLPKGYQISQYDLPIAHHGFLKINKQNIEITRIHLEEDTAKLIHPNGKNYTLIDFNRAGVPLLELVTEPVIHDGISARMFCQTFQQILKYLNISDANMEKGEMRCEVNISLQKKGHWFRDEQGQIKTIKNTKLNNKVEIKNINSFKSIEKAINYETDRQKKLIDNNEEILMETRGFNENKNETFRQRVKESSSDYRYFPEPDIKPIKISSEKIAEIKKKLIELPHNKKDRFIKEYGLTPEMSEILIENKNIADWTEKVISELHELIKSNDESWENQNIKLSKLSTNWISGELFKFLKKDKKNIDEIKIKPLEFSKLILLLHQEKITAKTGQEILEIMYKIGKDPENIMKENNLERKTEDNLEELEKNVEKVIKKYEKQWLEYQNGKEALLKFFIGQTMAETKGRFSASKIEEIIKNNLQKNE